MYLEFVLIVSFFISGVVLKDKLARKRALLYFNILKNKLIRKVYFEVVGGLIGKFEKYKKKIARIFESIILTMISFGIIIYILFWIVPLPFQFTEEKLSVWGQRLFIEHLSDKNILDILKFITNTSIAGLPLSLTFYYFYYREQKATSESAIVRNTIRIPCIMALFCFVLTGVYSTLLIHIFESSFKLTENAQFILFQALVSGEKLPDVMHMKITPLAITIVQQNRIIISLLLFILALFLGLILLKKLLSNINISNLLKQNIGGFKLQIEKLLLLPADKEYKDIRKDIYEKSQVLVESIYQMLIGAVEKNISVVYNDGIIRWVDVLTFLSRRGKVAPVGDVIVRYVYLLKTDTESYSVLYRTILRNHLLLIITLYNKNKTQEGFRCIRYYLVFKPDAIYNLQRGKEDPLSTEYFAVLHEIAIFLLRADVISFRKLLGEIQSSLKEREEILNVTMIIKALVVKAIRDDELKLLTELAYTLSNFMENIPGQYEADQVNCDQIDYSGNNFILKSGFTSNELTVDLISLPYYAQAMEGNIGRRKYKGIALYAMVQAAIKSIELGHYASTGFLIKYIVSNFESERIQKVYKRIKDNGGVKDDILEAGRLFEEINISFSVDKNTAQYCLRKLTILLYLQQRYRKDNQIQGFRCSPQEYLNIEILSIGDINYLFAKLQSVNQKYGLLSVSDIEFFNNIKQEMINIVDDKTVLYGPI